MLAKLAQFYNKSKPKSILKSEFFTTDLRIYLLLVSHIIGESILKSAIFKSNVNCMFEAGARSGTHSRKIRSAEWNALQENPELYYVHCTCIRGARSAMFSDPERSLDP